MIQMFRCKTNKTRLHGAVGSVYHCISRDHKFASLLGHLIFLQTDHEIILSLPLIQEQLYITGESISTSTG